MKIFNVFLDTISFLTIIPIKRKTEVFGYKMFLFFPVVSFFVGALCYLFFVLSRKIFSLEISVFLALFFYVFISGHLHLDGFVDTIDALFGSLNKTPVEILKDPHIGVVGCIFLFLVLFLKYLFLLEVNKILFVLMPVFSKTGLCIVGYFGRSLTNGIGKKFLYKNFWILFFSLLISYFIISLFLKNFLFLITSVFLNFFVSYFFTKFFNFKFGGVNGDVFGFVNEVLEVLFLILGRWL